MFQWHYSRNYVGRYGPFSAKQLKQLADAGRVALRDSIETWTTGVVSAPAYQMQGLLPPAHVLEVRVVSQASSDDCPSATVTVNGQVWGNGPLWGVSPYVGNVNVGVHIVSIKIDSWWQPRYDYKIEVSTPSLYSVELRYLGSGQFANQFRYFINPNYDNGVVDQRWQDERQAAQCPDCGVEWGGTHLGHKVVGREQRPRTIARMEEMQIDNPNYDRMHWFQHAMNGVPPTLRIESQRTVQVIAITETIRDYFECEQCGNKWERDRAHEYIP